MTSKKYLTRYWMGIVVILLATILASCKDDDETIIAIPPVTDLITDIYLPESMPAYHGENAAINGRGFQEGDILVLKSVEKELEIPLSSVAHNYARFYIPEDLKTADYSMSLKRGELAQLLGELHIRLVLNVTIPDKEDMTIKGVIYSGTQGLAGVRVSDGVNTTITDAEGFYWLPSDKYHGYVFICTPSGYQPATGTNVAPGFWSTLSEAATVVERHDFELKAVNQDKHIILAAADAHLANRGASSNDDMNQFNNGFMADARQFISSQSSPLYTFVLGDMSWDLYWYSKSYDIASYKKTMTSFTAPMYHVMGNHDNDPYVANDFKAEAKYKKEFGPSYYSMDIGKVHYVFLDNTIFINKGGKEGFVGERNYEKYLTDIQLNWLKEDLAAVTDKNTPIIVSFHCPSTSNYNSSFAVRKTFDPVSKTDEFHNCFSAFSNVHFLSGHTHYNANIQVSPNIREHNVAAVCETWWWAGKLTGQNVCKDGSPSGYKVFEVDGTNISWYYKGINQDRNKQFRTYDSNKVKEFFSRQDVINVISQIPGRKNDFALIPDNSIILNIWDYDPSWTISVKEGNADLTATRTYMRDPLHVLCYDYTRTATSGYTSSFLSNNNSHMFVIPTNSATGSLEITVTDSFGNIFKETMTRPKEFGKSMD